MASYFSNSRKLYINVSTLNVKLLLLICVSGPA